MDVFLFTLFNGILYRMLLFILSSGLTLILNDGSIKFCSCFILHAWSIFCLSNKRICWILSCFNNCSINNCFPRAYVERYGLEEFINLDMWPNLFTFGLFYIIEEIVQMVWGKVPVGIIYHQAWIFHYLT